MICCKAFKAHPAAYPNLSLSKIPQTVLKRCEWGRDDYSLNVENLPQAPREPQQQGIDFDQRENADE